MPSDAIPWDGLKYEGPMPKDGPADAFVVDDARDANPPEDTPVILDGSNLDAQPVDASRDHRSTPVDGDVDTGTIIAKYIAPMFDAPAEGTPVVRYGAPPFDTGGAQTKYMAPTPS